MAYNPGIISFPISQINKSWVWGRISVLPEDAQPESRKFFIWAVFFVLSAISEQTFYSEHLVYHPQLGKCPWNDKLTAWNELLYGTKTEENTVGWALKDYKTD